MRGPDFTSSYMSDEYDPRVSSSLTRGTLANQRPVSQVRDLIGQASPHEVAGVHQVLLDVDLGVVQLGAHPVAVPDLAAELHGALVTPCVLEILQ